MKIKYAMLSIYLLFFTSCGHTQNKNDEMNTPKYKFTNNLIHESSPYLLQHAHNPVNWFPWGREALDKARNENKLIIISIGYSACHWCHVMEHQSFEDEDVAKFMNDHFVAIKVDREERPDIDQIYMNAVHLMSGSGGWPLNCIALPDGRPIYGGTYFQKNQWVDMLAKVLEFVRKNPEKAEEQAKAVTQGIQSSEAIYSNTKSAEFTIDDLNQIFDHWKSNIDYVNGGEKRAPKFPLPIGYQFLLHYHYITNNKDALNAVTTTLNKMANGGIYDQIGGGFYRYSTDAFWKVPHFEKMLYDNAQLISLYSSAYQQTKDAKCQEIAIESLEFIKREMTSREGGFYSSLDADSEGKEGEFYVWTDQELQRILGEDAEIIKDYYHVEKNGNWENFQNILYKSDSDSKLLKKYTLTESELQKRISKAKKVLLAARANRIRPALDDKILTSWNALMLKAYVDAYRVFDHKEYLDIALKNADFIHSKMKSTENSLHRNYKDGKSSINAFLDDYAFTISAFISIYQATFDEKWLNEASQLTRYTLKHFYNPTSGMFYYTSDMDDVLIARKMEISDNVISSSNSEMAKNLFILGQYFYKDDYIEKSKKMLSSVKQNAINGRTYYANWDILMAWVVNKPFEVAIIGNDFETKRKEFEKRYLPNVFLSGGKSSGILSLAENKLVEGVTTIYVCQDKSCKIPVREVKDAFKQIFL